MPKPSTSTELAVAVRSVTRRLMQRFRSTQTFNGPSYAQMQTLAVIADHGPLTMSDLAKRFGIRPQTMAPTVNALFEQKLTSKRTDRDDARRSLFIITKAGERAVEAARSERTSWIARAIDECTSASERETLATALAILARVAEHE